VNPNFDEPETTQRILVIGADPAARDWRAEILRDAGYEVDGESDAKMAWAALARQSYELLVLDYQLPLSSGLRLVLKMQHAHLTLPVVLVTEGPLAFDPRTYGQLDLVTVLPLPFGAEDLLEVVLVTLQNRPAAKSGPRRQAALEAGDSTTRRPKPATRPQATAAKTAKPTKTK